MFHVKIVRHVKVNLTETPPRSRVILEKLIVAELITIPLPLELILLHSNPAHKLHIFFSNIILLSIRRS